MRKILAADLLCGAGGSSTGCERALRELGLAMELVCVNHWGVAIETHKKNHPEARHYVQDIAACRPHIIVPEGRLDLLMASPTCTHHSVARGGKPTSDQQRSDPWHINTWLTELDVARFIIENVWEFLGWGPVDHKTGKPIPALDTKGGVWLTEPLILNRNSAPRGETQPVSEPAPTVTTSGGGYLVEPFILSRQGGGAPRDVEEPTPTQCAKHSHALISPYYGSGSGETCKSVEQPLDTVTARDRFGIVVPVTHSQGGNAARDVSEPIPTMTTAKGGEFGVVVPVTHAGGEERARGVSEPLPTIATGNRGGEALAEGIVTPVFDGERYDILFRMLEPHELAAAMGFDTDEAKYEFAGTKTEQIKQIGNAVSVAMMKAEVHAIMADAAPKKKPQPAAEPRAEAVAA
ncbi:MAG TPA: DNA cytosine methyltransferase [Rhizomicrobium sp.]|nr:DNA cytosine methyltransferase [Rhizomicrobium sp.]